MSFPSSLLALKDKNLTTPLLNIFPINETIWLMADVTIAI
jgi:hypothetical protein